MTPVEEIAIPSHEEFERALRPRYRPFVLRGTASGWPLVKAGRESAEAALALIERHDSGAPADIMIAAPGERGRFFYAPNMRGFNFQRQKGTLSQLAGQLRALEKDPAPPGIYSGATATRSHLPGFEEAHPFPLHARGVTGPPSPERDATMRRFIAQVLAQG